MRVHKSYSKTMESLAMVGFGISAKNAYIFRTGQMFARALWPLAAFLSPVTVNRLPKPVKKTFRRRTS